MRRALFLIWVGLLLAGAASADGGGQAKHGSAYVPLDSWIYPALDRLADLGRIPSQISGLRPWTRAECRRQALEAAKSVEPDALTGATIRALLNELDGDSEGVPAAVLETAYIRNGVIAGPMLNDSLHFGQTWSDDFGRPYGRGWNLDAGLTARVEAGPFFAGIRTEIQRAPAQQAYPLSVRQTIANLDDNPVQPGVAQAAIDRVRPVEAYAGVRLGDFAISAGRQSMWWGPTYDGPLSFSDNAEPSSNLKISTVMPLRLPVGIEARGEFVMGKLGGQKYTWRPWFNAQKLSFKLTRNLEMGFTRWSIFWGVGHPMTLDSLARNFTSLNSPTGPAGLGATDPGDRKGGFDFRYRVPGLRDWLTIYSDSYSDDDPSPLAAPRRAAINPGIHLTRIPGLSRMDLRVEAPSTTPMAGDRGGWFIYINDQYHSGNTNYGNLLGNAVGRDGRAIQAWTTYWLSADSTVQLSVRQFKGGSKFLPGGASQSDASLKGSFGLGNAWHADMAVQYERFLIPVLGGEKRNVSATLTLRWEPELRLSLSQKRNK